MDLFMDCSRVVDNGRLNGLPLDDRLNCSESDTFQYAM